MNRLVSPGIIALLLVLVAGVWLVIAPFAIGFQPTGGLWITATKNDVAAGAFLIVVALAGTLLFVGLGLRDVVRAAAQRQPAPEPDAAEG